MNFDPPKDTSGAVVEVGLGVVLRERGMSGVCLGGRREVLLTKRPVETVYAGWWEFPGGKVEEGESIEECVRRELREEIGIEVADVRRLLGLDCLVHRYEHATVRLHPRLCEIAPNSMAPQNLRVSDHLWAGAEELSRLQLLPANESITALVVALLRGGVDGRMAP